MTDGLKFVKYALLQQENDPLEFCVCSIPLPSNIGIPLFPCELPNNFTLFSSNENHTQIGMKILDLEEEESYRIQRALCCPSARPFSITSRDFYNNIPIQGQRDFTIPYCREPILKVKHEGINVGSIVQRETCGFLKGRFHSLEILDNDGNQIYEITANLKQKGLLCFLPFNSCSKIVYEILDVRQKEIDETNYRGTIQHIFYGWDNEFCSKADQYGITFPEDSSEQEKALIVMAAVFIDYLWFENI